MIDYVPRRAPSAIALFALVATLSSFAVHAATPELPPQRAAAPSQPRGGGGPDTFGYTWAVSSGPPGFSWIDISTTGTLVTGLADDNSAAPIALPFPFRYYWTDIQQLTIGSNGWIALGTGISNIASCFPSIPTAGGAGDSYAAPLMGDLNFTGAGNPGTVRYEIDTLAQRVVISYLDVPWWRLAAPGWVGSNTFQVILDAPTRSIKYQYLNLSAAQLNAGCVDLVGGIESPQGSYGLQLFNDALPPGNRAIEFTYPDPPLISVIDPAPSALLNPASAGAFVLATQPLTPTATVTNDGDGATTSPVSVRGRILDAGAIAVYDQTVSIPSLAGGAQAPVTFTPDATLASGHYSYRIDVSGGGDINLGNNIRQSEIVAVPAGTTVFDYVGSQASNATLDWNNAPNLTDDDGAGVLIVPPAGAYTVTALGVLITSNPSTTFKLKLMDNDGPNGLPGSVLGEVLVTPAQTVLNAWADYPLVVPAPVDADGFYLFWIDRGTAVLGTTTTGPFSRRSLELLGGGYAAWRSNEVQDLFLRVTVAAAIDPYFANGFEDP